MPQLANKAVVDLGRKTLYIDGQEFPWHITEDGIDVEDLNNANAIPVLSFRMLALTVEVTPAEEPTTEEK